MKFKEDCDLLRKHLKQIGNSVFSLKTHELFKEECPQDQDRGEMIANIMLSYRHIEDARMRIGKILQAKEGGVSILDK